MQSELGKALAAYRWAFIALAAFSLVINLLGLVPSLYMLQLYDRVLASRNLGTLWAISGIAIGLILLLALLEAVRSRILVRLGNRLDHNLNQRIFGANFNQLLKDGGGNPVQALTDFTQVRQFITGPAAAYFDLPWAPIYLIACFLLHPVLGWVAVFGLVVSITLGFISSRMTEPVLSKAQATGAQANNFAANQLRNAEVMTAMGMVGNIRAHWHRMHHQMMAHQSQASDRAASLQSLSKNFRIGMQSVILGAGAYLVIEGTATPGTMIAASILMGKALGPIDQLVGSFKQVVAARESWARLNKLLAANPEPLESLSLPKPKGFLKVEGLLAAPPGRPGLVLRGVGASASGKSTLARVLVGVWPAVGGSVRLDSADIFAWNKTELGPHLGYLPQDVSLFDGTVAENIARFGTLNAPAIVQAAQAALSASGLAAADITHVITVSCTGFFAPGPDYAVVRGLELRADVQRFHVGFMGCYAAFPALRMAKAFCEANPQANVLVICAELCTLHMHSSSDPDTIIANSVFADGAAAALVSAQPPSSGKTTLTPLGIGEAEMAWTVGDQGFDMVLSTYVPSIIESHIVGALVPLLAHSSTPTNPQAREQTPPQTHGEQVQHWAIHPGGRSILDKVQSSLSLSDAQLRPSREVLRLYGNMSSVTILFILADLLQTVGEGEQVCAMAFGPGLTVESGLMTRVAGV